MTLHRFDLIPLLAVLTTGLLAFAQETPTDETGRRSEDSTHQEARRSEDERRRENERRAQEAYKESRKQIQEAMKQAQKQMDEARKQARLQAEEARKQAQKQMQEARKQIQEAMKQYRDVSRLHVLGSFFPRLGLVMKFDASSTGAGGIAIQGVTPGSPAEKAGLKAGDVVTALDGLPLVEVPDGGSESSGRLFSKAASAVHRLRPGESVTIEYRRGKESRTAELKMEPKGSRAWSVSSDDWRGHFRWLELPDHWQELELVTISPELGQYFGTKQGLLVVRASTADANLKPGDVILKIGDEQLSTPTQAVRALRSYEPGKEVPVEILRQKEKRTVAIRLPVGEQRSR